MRDLFSKEFQKEMDDFFDYIDYEVLGKTKPEEDDGFLDKYCPLIYGQVVVFYDHTFFYFFLLVYQYHISY